MNKMSRIEAPLPSSECRNRRASNGETLRTGSSSTTTLDSSFASSSMDDDSRLHRVITLGYSSHGDTTDDYSEYEEEFESEEEEEEEVLDDLERELRGFEQRRQRSSSMASGVTAKSNGESKRRKSRKLMGDVRRRVPRCDRTTAAKCPTYFHQSMNEDEWDNTSGGDSQRSGCGGEVEDSNPHQKKTKRKSVRSLQNKHRPAARLLELLSDGVKPTNMESTAWESAFQDDITKERVAAYHPKAAKAAKGNKLDKLKKYCQRNPKVAEGCTEHGETLLHLACRRSHAETVEYLIAIDSDTRNVVRVRDEAGRTVLHEAVWTNQPNFDMIWKLLQTAPELLFVKDHRQFTPLHYIPEPCFNQWNSFLKRHATALKLLVNHRAYQRSRDQLNEAQERMQALLHRAVTV